MIEGHGDDIYRYGGKVKYNFSSNICAPSSLGHITDYISANKEILGSYPEPYPASLESALAATLRLSADSVIVTNGATEAIYLIAHAYKQEVSAIVSPTFSEYEDACRLYNHSVLHIDTVEALPPEARVVWLCNPCNPTGKVTDADLLKGIVHENPDKIFVIDQAYADYTTRRVLDPCEAVDTGNVLLLGSFTKRYSVPGLRIGYALGAAKLLTRVRACRMPWSVNAVAVAAARCLLSDTESKVDASALHSEALRVAEALRNAGIMVQDTDCNFMLCRLPHGSAADLKEWLVDNHGILIRDASNFHGLSRQHFRVAVQTREADDLLIKAIKEWMSF